MAKDFLLIKSADEVAKPDIYTLNRGWAQALIMHDGFKDTILGSTIAPYVAFVSRIDEGLSWVDRLYILFTGRIRP